MSERTRSAGRLIMSLCAVVGPAVPAAAQVDQQRAEAYFQEAATLCERDGGRLWGVSLCGPMVIADAKTQTIAANQTPPAGERPGFLGFANASVEWGGVRWATYIGDFIPADDRRRRGIVMLHELFHRIQPQLGLMTQTGQNRHLDTIEGRYWLQLEWRALAQALRLSGQERTRALRDALAFRLTRRTTFPGAAENERLDEIREGLAQYTGTVVAAATAAEAAASAIDQLADGEKQETFVQTFAYPSGVAYGILLDAWSPGWTRRVQATSDLGQFSATFAQDCTGSSPRWLRAGPRGPLGKKSGGRLDMNGFGLDEELGRIPRTGAVLCARTICLAGATMLLMCAGPAGAVAQAPTDWRLPPGHEQLLPDSLDCWEPALAVGPRRHVFVVAGRRAAPLRTTGFDQQLVMWRSNDAGATFSAPSLVTTEGHFHYDQRMAVDAKGTIYISYLDNETARPRSVTRLRLARSRDQGRTFSVETVTTQRVSDKPELAVSADGMHIAIVFESSPGPTLVSSDDGGATWNEPRVVVQGEGRHFWPESLTVGSDGVLWFAVPSMSAAEIAVSKETPVRLHVFRSSDGGRLWHDSDFGSSPRFVKDCAHDPDCRVKSADVAVAIDDRGQAYVTYMEGTGPRKPYGLFLRSSTDAGRSWSKPQVVSAALRPRSGDRADQDFPMIAASSAGRVCVVWVDDRRGALDV